MTRRLTRTGEGLALVLDQALLEQLRIDPDTPLEVSTDGQVIVIAPVRDPERDARVKAIADEMFQRYEGVFRKLAE